MATDNPSPESQPSAIVTHIEHYLGPVSDGWKTTGGGEQLAFPLARFAPMPQPGWSVVSTLGLSANVLQQPSGAEIRQELLICWPDEGMDDTVPSHLYAIGKTIQAAGESVGHGAILPMPVDPPLPSGSDETWAAWYVTLPFFLPESAVLCQGTEPPTVLAWLFPVYTEEARFIAEAGADAFEARMLDDRAGCFAWPRKSLCPESH